MKPGSAFGISIRSRRMPSSRARSAASTSRSQRISRWSETKPTGQTSTSRRLARAARRGGRGCPGPSHGSPVADSDWYENDQSSSRRPRRRAATSRAAAPRRGRRSPSAGRLCAVKTTCVCAADAVGEQRRRSPDRRASSRRTRARRGRRARPRAARGSRRSRAASSAGRARGRRRSRRPVSRARSAASAMRGVQCFMPVKTGTPSSSLERGPRLLGDRVERIRALDPEAAVALDEVRLQSSGLIGRPPRMSA